MPIRKYSLAPLPERRVHRRASPALTHLGVAHATLQGIFESLHVVRQAANSSGKDARGRLKEGEVSLPLITGLLFAAPSAFFSYLATGRLSALVGILAYPAGANPVLRVVSNR